MNKNSWTMIKEFWKEVLFCGFPTIELIIIVTCIVYFIMIIIKSLL